MIYLPVSIALVAVSAAVSVAVADPPAKRAADLLAQMTVEEKVTMLHGEESGQYTGVVAGNARLGIPSLRLSDGPQGMRDNNHVGTTTAFPSGLTVGATWDLELCKQWGEAMGEEFFGKGANVQLGPGMNIARVPLNGRNFEYMSGGDSYLGYKLVQPVIKGIQSKGVIANAKHWVENNQETDRDTVSEMVDERTRHEFYYRPFAGAVEAGVGSFMCSYNKVNGLWSCENPETLRADLKGHLGFEGWVMSDWGATHSLSIEQGLDQEMPRSDFFGETLLNAVATGSVSEETVNAAVMRVLVPMFEVGLFDKENTNELSNDVRSPAHTLLTRELAAASHVLLKNENNTLPLSVSRGSTKIALFGGGVRAPIVAGGGSGNVFPAHIVTPLEAIFEVLGIIDQNPVITTCDASDFVLDVAFDQSGCQSAPGLSAEDCAKQCSDVDLCSFFTFAGDRCEFYPTSGGRRPSPGAVSGECVRRFAHPTSDWQCNEQDICVASVDASNLEAVSRLASEADIAIAVIGTFSKEASDRESLSFAQIKGNTCQVVPPNQDEMISIISSRVPTIVAMTSPGAVLTPWRDGVQSMLLGFLPGEEYGHALMDVIFGAVNPSGRLPISLPNVENEVGFSRAQYPGVAKHGVYSEGMHVDYRWYTSHAVTPAFAFGHGLSYTSFAYSNMTMDSAREWRVTVKNVGQLPGADVVQLYIQFPADAMAPPLQLKGFHKTDVLAAGQDEVVKFELTDVDLSVWSVRPAGNRSGWAQVPGTYKVFIGSSSADLRLSGSFEM